MRHAAKPFRDGNSIDGGLHSAFSGLQCIDTRILEPCDWYELLSTPSGIKSVNYKASCRDAAVASDNHE